MTIALKTERADAPKKIKSKIELFHKGKKSVFQTRFAKKFIQRFSLNFFN